MATNRAPAGPQLPRITRLMALAMQLQSLQHEHADLTYQDLARLGHVSASRLTQILNLLHLAPDLQERLLWLEPNPKGRDLIQVLPTLAAKRLTKPRTACFCQPVAAVISASVTPLARFIIAITAAFLPPLSRTGPLPFVAFCNLPDWLFWHARQSLIPGGPSRPDLFSKTNARNPGERSGQRRNQVCCTQMALDRNRVAGRKIMSHNPALCMVWLLYLNLPLTAMAQARDPQIDELKKETAQLKVMIADQERRIAELEKMVKALQAVAAPVPAAIPSATPPWRRASNWILIKKGMSEAQVVEILGPPTSVDSSIDVRTLLYQPDSHFSSTLSVSVTLTDDRVTAAKPPAI